MVRAGACEAATMDTSMILHATCPFNGSKFKRRHRLTSDSRWAVFNPKLARDFWTTSVSAAKRLYMSCQFSSGPVEQHNNSKSLPQSDTDGVLLLFPCQFGHFNCHRRWIFFVVFPANPVERWKKMEIQCLYHGQHGQQPFFSNFHRYLEMWLHVALTPAWPEVLGTQLSEWLSPMKSARGQRWSPMVNGFSMFQLFLPYVSTTFEASGDLLRCCWDANDINCDMLPFGS